MFREEDKEELKNKIYNQISIDLSMPSFNSYESLDQQLSNIKYSVENSIEMGIRQAVSAIIDELYTHENFERDIGLT